jgi:sialic acid synthase SpsE
LANNFWSTVLDEGFDELAEILSPLIKYREQKGPLDGPSNLNLQDVIQTKEMVEFGPKNEAVSISKYREMVEAKIAELIEKNPILQMIKSGEQVTKEEAEQLAEELHEEDPHITEQLLRKVYNHQKAKFIQFIKHILGIEILESFNVPAYKVASADLTNLPLIDSIVGTKKPIILSTGMSSVSEIQITADFLNARNAEFVLLHCNSTYLNGNLGVIIACLISGD